MILNASAEKGCIIGGMTLNYCPALSSATLDWRNISRCRQVLNNRIKHTLHTLVLEGRAAQTGTEFHLQVVR
jgi:hypothetical protein